MTQPLDQLRERIEIREIRFGDGTDRPEIWAVGGPDAGPEEFHTLAIEGDEELPRVLVAGEETDLDTALLWVDTHSPVNLHVLRDMQRGGRVIEAAFVPVRPPESDHGSDDESRVQ